MITPRLKCVVFREFARLPQYSSAEAAGLDLAMAAWSPCEARPNDESQVRVTSLILDPGDRALVRTGLKVAVPYGYEGQVRPRSGLSLKQGLVCALGTIDSDYTGELGVILFNLGDERQQVFPGERVAQLVIAPIARVTTELVSSLQPTARSEGGFGSTGLASMKHECPPYQIDPFKVPYSVMVN